MTDQSLSRHRSSELPSMPAAHTTACKAQSAKCLLTAPSSPYQMTSFNPSFTSIRGLAFISDISVSFLPIESFTLPTSSSAHHLSSHSFCRSRTWWDQCTTNILSTCHRSHTASSCCRESKGH